MHAYICIQFLKLGRMQSDAVWIYYVPDAIHNLVAIKLLMSGLLT